MANRLSRIVTRTGDDGSTGLADGTRVSKDDLRITVIGEVDELNSHIGVLLAETLSTDIRNLLLQIQNDLFDLGGTLALPGTTLPQDKLHRLDVAVDDYNANLPPLKEFILPGGTRAAALCHVARTQARCAERNYVELMHRETVSQEGLRYLNRLSDLLFILSRIINQAASQAETLWKKQNSK
jgi:cob(I)alamin adenosyltransferase